METRAQLHVIVVKISTRFPQFCAVISFTVSFQQRVSLRRFASTAVHRKPRRRRRLLGRPICRWGKLRGHYIRKRDLTIWTRFILVRTGPMAGSCENTTFRFHKSLEFVKVAVCRSTSFFKINVLLGVSR